ncbi:SIR2 family protein [Staphylococcus pseudoxylosus]|uniref:SIR2 family protein n=1 Tax=Staphylococcus pseudoxylosus TaxID=2282419 RepID=UPI003F566B21
MKIEEFINEYSNHPVLFIGTGLSLRYLNNSYSWENLLQHICYQLTGNKEIFYDYKDECQKEDSSYDFPALGEKIENLFNETLKNEREGNFKEINDEYYNLMEKGINISRFKIYISKLFKKLNFKTEFEDEFIHMKKARKNIGSIVTTNYDKLVENLFEFNPLIGNQILLSNPYGSVYKIHGCVSQPDKIVLTSEDYNKFNTSYELIRAQLLSLFIHNPIIFLGYSINDENIRDILETIYKYVDVNSDLSERIRRNFLLVEFDEGSKNKEVVEHDIQLENNKVIRINKIKTEDYISIYKALGNLELSVSAMDIRKVQNVVKDIYKGGKTKVEITEDIDDLNNSEKILAIGSTKTIKYEFQTVPELMQKYFQIEEEENKQILDVINKQIIQKNQFFPIYCFSNINSNINNIEKFKKQQIEKIKNILKSLEDRFKIECFTIEEISNNGYITPSREENVLVYNVIKGNIALEDLKKHLLEFENKNNTPYKKLLCVYDLQKYGPIGVMDNV